MSESGQMKFYNSTGAAQFQLIEPQYREIVTKSGEKRFILDKEGAVLLQVAPGNGDKNNPAWDWARKISMAISFTDICQLVETTEEFTDSRGKTRNRNRLRGGGEPSARVFHNHEGTPKTMQFEPGQDDYAYTWRLVVAQGKGADRSQVMVPLSDGQHQMIMKVLTGLASRLVGLE